MMTQLLLKYLYLFLFLLYFSQINGQGRSKPIPSRDRFSAGIVLGINNAQIDGDYNRGFDKFGITGGLRGITKLTPRLTFNLELLYSQKGSRILEGSANRQRKNRIIDLIYMDTPFFLKYLWKDKKHTIHLEFGLIYSRLIRTKLIERETTNTRLFVYRSILDDFKNDDFSYFGGVGWTANKRMALNFRYVISRKNFYEEENINKGASAANFIVNPVTFLRNYYYSLTCSYRLF